jgi:hypothetical protein
MKAMYKVCSIELLYNIIFSKNIGNEIAILLAPFYVRNIRLMGKKY